MIKMVAEYLGYPLTHVINTCIADRHFPSAWKTARICAIPKGNYVSSEKDLRPIWILPVLSKVYERLIFRQLADFIDKNKLLNSNIAACRKGQSTTTVLQAIRDDIIKAMKRGEVTMMVLADFSKAFDTVSLQKPYHEDEQDWVFQGFSDMDTKLCFKPQAIRSDRRKLLRSN